MKRLILTVMIAGLMAPAGLMAQKVYKDGSAVILDLTVVAGMPADAVTSTPKTWVGTPAPSGSMLTDNDHNGSINATVYHKLEVAPHDLNKAGTMGISGSFTMNWVTAFDGCKNAAYDGGGWRLPTQRELMLVYIFKPALESIFTDAAINGTAFSSVAYWSATENMATNSWTMTFTSGYTSYSNKTSTYRVRCVREVD